MNTCLAISYPCHLFGMPQHIRFTVVVSRVAELDAMMALMISPV